ncbi:hypothetical protein L873DRAFT_652357 [Choiromyces venosus 120613-1]|uniref:Uncharacterized protein n=1 Tax=Choiromyces venosus 120613-1 TaxID=1336337 RepID=A0A3N4IU18_9PEZI|nr:hypothetical protein L873DRAFT_652357 [Choiromyces venosus 120613-1]
MPFSTYRLARAYSRPQDFVSTPQGVLLTVFSFLSSLPPSLPGMPQGCQAWGVQAEGRRQEIRSYKKYCSGTYNIRLAKLHSRP